MNWSNYSVDGQLSIFDYISNTEMRSKMSYEFSWDKDINEIHYKLLNLTSKYDMSVTRDEWSVWKHVANLGYRMSITIDIRKEQLTEEFLKELNDIVDYANSRKVELSPMSPIFLGEDENGWMHIFSMFLDRERQKIK